MPQGPLTPDDFASMGAAGVGTLRFEIFWAGIDPTPADGDYNWSAVDATVARAARQDITLLPIVTSEPGWVAALDGHLCAPGCPVYPPKGERALAAWRSFLADAVERYGPDGDFWAANPGLPATPIRNWQIWNEQNSLSYWYPRPSVSAYATILHAARVAIKSADPGARIVLGGMFGTPRGGRRPAILAWDYLARLYRRPGVKRDFDVVAPHPYAASMVKVRGQVRRLHRVMVAAGDARTKLWITEVGWASGGEPNPLNVGLSGQAARLEEALGWFIRHRRRLRIGNVTWYSWRDNESPDIVLCLWCPRSGLLTEDGTAKPSYDAFARLTGAG